MRYKVGRNDKFACPCCENDTLDEVAVYEICPVCFWEDDGTTNLDDASGPNYRTLREGKETYVLIGACAPGMLRYCRPPLEDEKP